MGKFGEIDSADTHAGKFPLVSMGAERRVPRARTRERGPPSALAELSLFNDKVYPTLIILDVGSRSVDPIGLSRIDNIYS